MSPIKYLFDENMDPRFRSTLLRRRAEIDVLQIGDLDAPPRETADLEILLYTERTHRVLVTNNRDSMPDHLQEHWRNGGRCWGIFWVKPNTSFSKLAEELEFIWGTTEAEEWLDITLWLPEFT